MKNLLDACTEEFRAIIARYPRSIARAAFKVAYAPSLVDGPDRTKRLRLAPSKKARLYAKQDGFCPRCGRRFLFDEMTVDHINPIAAGGGNEMWNLRLICQRCNREKGSTDIATDARNIGKTVASQLPGHPPLTQKE